VRELVFIGLGNPGKRYEKTRHNMGFLVVGAFANLQKWTFKLDKRFQAQVAKGQVEETSLHLLLPMTYMNESGQPVRRYLDFYKIDAEHILVVCDDIALPFGTMRLRKKGSAGGHNGLKSIETHLGTDHYARLRMGIGRDSRAGILSKYVLDDFSLEESAQLREVIHQGALVLRSLINESITQVMNRINTKVDLTEGQEN
jgi:PTH1 family peptidyl-tRNA hydrolase